VTNENGGEIEALNGGTVIFKDVAGDINGASSTARTTTR
jgi:hypothetical protein